MSNERWKKIVAQIPMHKICRDPGNDSRCLCYICDVPPPGQSLHSPLCVVQNTQRLPHKWDTEIIYSLGSDSSQLDLLCKRATTNIIRRVASITRHCIDAMVRLLYCFSCYRGCSRFCLSRRDWVGVGWVKWGVAVGVCVCMGTRPGKSSHGSVVVVVKIKRKHK